MNFMKLPASKDHILLTGATGFLGSHLLRHLVDTGYTVSILIRSTSSTHRIEEELPYIACVYDMDTISLDTIFDRNPSLSTVIHTAACYSGPLSQVFETNTLFSLQLLESAAKHGIELFLNTDTSLPANTSPYAASKKAFSSSALQYCKSTPMRFCNLLLEHMLGPDDNPARLPMMLMRECLANAGSIPLTEGLQERDFIFVEDVCTAYLTLLEQREHLSSASEFPVGSGKAVAIRDLAEQIKGLTGSTSHLDFGARPYRENEVMYSAAETQDLKSLGWAPQKDLVTGLKECIEHYQEM